MPDFTGDNGDNTLNGGSDADTIKGNGGNDTVTGGGGADVVSGGTGADTVSGQDGDDQLYSDDVSPSWNRPYYGNPWTAPVLDHGTEIDTLDGGTGNDWLYAGYGDDVDGGADYDSLLISFAGAPSGVTIDFRELPTVGSIVVGGGTLTNIEGVEWIEGSNYADTIQGGDNSSNFAPIFGMGGNDLITGGYYTGNIYGGDGDDTLDKGTSPYGFELYGDAGNDTLLGSYNGDYQYGGTGDDTLRGRGGFDSFYGEDGNDLIEGDYYGESARGGAGNDLIYTSGGDDTIDGGTGDDLIHADRAEDPAAFVYDSSDRVFAGAGADIVYGGGGNDFIWSGERDGDFGYSGLDDSGLEYDQIFAGDGDDTLSVGYGDDADGGAGNDSARIVLAGAASGVSVNTSGYTGSGIWTLFGGDIANIESLTIVGSAFADTFTIATHGFGFTVDLGGGDDLVTSSGSSALVTGGLGNDILISGAAGDIFDGGADTDTVDYRNAASGVTVTLALVAGGTGTGAGGDQLVNVENVTGSAHNDTLNGNDEANLLLGQAGADTLNGNGGHDTLNGGAGTDTLNGGEGNDVLNGAAGNDTMAGGLGDDFFYVDAAGDLVSETADNGSDRVFASVNFTLAAGAHVEILSTTNNAGTGAINLTGNEFANSIAGNNGANVLDGAAGNDTLDGLAGADTLTGGAGNDRYVIDSAGDVVIEVAGGGTDTVASSIAYTLGAELENLVLTGTAAINGLGNSLTNGITGNNGVNVLNGGAGADTLNGLGGNDFLYVDNAGDVIVEGAGGGSDRVYASVSYALGAAAQVEVLTTTDSAGVGAINLTGNGFANSIAGNNGVNVLNGGAGADTLNGLGGNDFFYVDNAGDVIVEAAGGGSDRVYTSVSYTLGAAAQVEVLTTTDNAGTGAINLTGNGFANSISGNNGVNVLNGGAGADILNGLGGNDFFHVDNAGDVIVEAAGGGSDRVYASVSYVLGAAALVEILSTTDSASTAAINLTGNSFANSIGGNAGANVLDGLGGSDTLSGLGGADTFRFTTALGAGNVDTISGYSVADDVIHIDNAVFAGLAAGALAAGAFNTGAAATQADDRIIYNSATGALLFDADGNGAGAAIQFATLSAGLAMAASEFVVI